MTLRFNRSPRGERNMTFIENIALQSFKTTNEKKNGTKTKTYEFLVVRDIHKTPFEKNVFFFFKIT